MKTYSVAAQAALAAGSVLSVAAVKIATASPLRVWGGYGDLSLTDAVAETYLGIGDAGLVTATGAQLGGSEDGIEIRLSGVDPLVVGIVDAADARNARVTIWRLLFDVSGRNLLDAHVFERGRLDKISTQDVPGGAADIRCYIETAARGLGRATNRLTSDADQRLISATDGSCSNVTLAPELQLAWGGKPPSRAANVLPGTYVGAPGGLGGGGRYVGGADSYLN